MTLSRIRKRGLLSMSPSRPQHRIAPMLALTAFGFLGMALPAHAADPAKPAPRFHAKAGANIKAPLSVVWKFTGSLFPNNPASPTLANGVLYYATGKRIHAIDARSGALKWRYPADVELTSAILTTPTVQGSTVYFGTGDGLYALNIADGKQRWPHYNARGGVATSPVIAGSTVYFGSGDQKIYAINADTGQPDTTIWSTNKRAGREIGGDFAGNLVLANDMIYFVTGDQIIRAVSLTSATQKWANRLPANAASATPVVSGDTVYIAVGEGVYGWRAASGQQRLAAGIGGEATTPPALDDDGNLYAVNSDRYLVSVSQRGRPNWKQAPQLEHEAISAPVVVGNLVVVGTGLGGVYAYDKSTAELKWRYVVQPTATKNDQIPTATNITVTPLASEDTLYVASDDGAITAFRAEQTDVQAPLVTIQEPLQGEYISGRSPFYIRAKVQDDGSGLKLDTVTLLLDGQPVFRRPSARAFTEKPGFSIDPDTGELEYTILENESGQRTTLADGHHTLTISAKDWSGNTVNKSWVFYVDDTIRPKARKSSTTGPNGAGNNGRGRNGSGGGAGGKGGGGGGGGANNN